MSTSEFAKRYIEDVSSALSRLPADDLARAMEELKTAHRERRHVFLAGNGGSASTASHMVNDLVKGVSKSGGIGFRATALSDNISLITAIANDLDYSEVFAAQLKQLAQPRDLLIVISGSGNSRNIVRAAEEARRIGMVTIGFLGMGGGAVKDMVDIPVVVPLDAYGPVEDIHLMFNHIISSYFHDQQLCQQDASVADDP